MSTDLESEHVAIMQALRNQIEALKLGGLRDGEVQVREDYYLDDVPYEGCTIHDLGERYRDGPIGTHDVGYMTGVTLVAAKNRDAIVTSDWLPTWREGLRRRFQNQRLPVGEADGIRHHVCRVEDGKPKSASKFENYRIQQLLIVVWNREPKKLERTRP